MRVSHNQRVYNHLTDTRVAQFRLNPNEMIMYRMRVDNQRVFRTTKPTLA